MITRVVAFTCGSFVVPRGLMIGGGPLLSAPLPVRYPFLCFGIEHADGTWILVDTGQDPTLSGGLGVVREGFMRWTGAMEIPAGQCYSAHLAALGITRSKIRAVALTHLDYDHTGGLRAVAGSPVFTDPAGWRWASAPGLRERISGRTAMHEYAAVTVRREVSFARAADVPVPGGAFEIPEGEGRVRLVSLPGHTPGHAGVLVAPEEGLPRLLLSGDACIYAEQVTERAPVGPLGRVFAVDVPQLLSTLEDLRRWHAQEPTLRVVPSHDPNVGARCGSTYAVLYDRAREEAATPA